MESTCDIVRHAIRIVGRAEGGALADNKSLRTNDQIRVREVRLIDDSGEQKGVVATVEALRMAREQGLDLVEIAPQSVPPVCKIIDYGKFKFEQEKKLKDNRKHQKIVKLKEIRMQVKVDANALDFKSKHIKDFLAEGDKVKITVRFRGRELAHTELGEVVLKSMLSRLEGQYVLEKPPLMEGRSMSMIISPKVVILKKPEGPRSTTGEAETQAKPETDTQE